MLRTLKEGQRHLQKNELELAVKSFRRVTKWLPNHCHANLQLSYLCFHSGNIEQAITHVKSALRSEPNNLTAWAQLMAIHKRVQDNDSYTQTAESINERGLSLDRIEKIARTLSIPPKDRLDSLIGLLQNGNLVNTEIAARLFIENYPEHPLGWQILGEVLHDSGHLAEALGVKQLAVETFPKDANVYNNLARTLLAMKDYEGAKANAEMALKIDSSHKNALIHLSRAKRALEREGS